MEGEGEGEGEEGWDRDCDWVEEGGKAVGGVKSERGGQVSHPVSEEEKHQRHTLYSECLKRHYNNYIYRRLHHRGEQLSLHGLTDPPSPPPLPPGNYYNGTNDVFLVCSQ